jgi:RecB family exonuclease
VRWLVESLLRPRRLDPDPDPMRRGSLAHAVLERTLRGLKASTGSARLTPATAEAAVAELGAAMGELRATRGGVRARAELRALEVDLRRVLEHECAEGPGLEPEWLEWSFGREDDEAGPLELGGLRLTGRVDRIDVGSGGVAVVRDYKNSAAYPQARWAEEGHLQVALYALAARELLGLDPAGAVYEPLRGKDLRPRGALREDVADGAVDNDVVDAAGFQALLDGAREHALEAAASLRAGRISPCPERCTPKGCAYPGICRAPDVSPAEEAG